MACQAFDYSTHLQVPNDHLGIFSCAGDKTIALADVNVGDEVEVAVEASLQGQRVPVPNLKDPTAKQRKSFELNYLLSDRKLR